MSSLTTYCPSCGMMLAPGFNGCPQCTPAIRPSGSASRSGWLDVLWAFLVWGVSGGFLLSLELVYRAFIWLTSRKMPDLQLTRPIVIASLALTLIMHLVAFGASWLAVTRVGRRPFWQTLGWSWHPRFRWYHAVGVAILMAVVIPLLEILLPHKETELEKILKMGMAVRLMIVFLAVVTAPLVEEVVYRGALYSSVEGVMGKGAAVAIVTFMFALVHAPQYWGSVAALTAIFSLSLVLTFLRAWTGKLLPCVVTHLVYNGAHAIFLLMPEKLLEKLFDKSQTQTAFVIVGQNLGLF